MEPTTITLKEHFDHRLNAVEKDITEFRLEFREDSKALHEKIDKLVDKQSELKVEHVKTGMIATLVIACAEAVRWFGSK